MTEVDSLAPLDHRILQVLRGRPATTSQVVELLFAPEDRPDRSLIFERLVALKGRGLVALTEAHGTSWWCVNE